MPIRAILLTVVTTMLFVAACGSSEDDDGFVIEDALEMRRSVSNQTGRQHVSLAHYQQLGTELCEGAVNDNSRLLELARQESLGAFTSDESAASNLWVSAQQLCPGAFDDENTNPPFEGAVGNPPPSTQIDGLPEAFPPFADISGLDFAVSNWRENTELGIFSTIDLTGAEAVDLFGAAFPSGWTVANPIGPIADSAGFDTWSIDVEGQGWRGTVDVLSGPIGSFGVEDRGTYVIMVFVPA